MEQSLSACKISFIGGGSMAEAIIRGLVTQSLVIPSSIYVLGRAQSDKPAALALQYGITPATAIQTKAEALAASDIVVLAMKPKDAAEAVLEYRGALRSQQLIVSVIAGLSIAALDQLIGQALPIVRTMPNTSSTIGQGATGLAYNRLVNDSRKQLARLIFASIGMVREVPEQQLDILTGVSGSGPAYVYYFVESMIAGGVAGGLDEQSARELTIQTVLGAAEMLKQTGEDPAQLRRKVTSPNGTTEAALALMRANDVGEHITNAVLRAAERAAEIGHTIDEQINRIQGGQSD
jgi:pyrroline-5-carboxylate reductase